MNFKKALVSTALVASLVLGGCTAKEAANVPKESVTEKKEVSKTLDYDVTREVIEDGSKNIKIYYPQVKDYPGELLMDYMNQSLKRTADLYGNEETYTDINVDYEITKMDENILSVVFTGKGKNKSYGEINIVQSVNLDMTTSNEITYDNFIKNNEEVMKILNEKAKEQGLEAGVEAEGIRIYFKGEDVTFYYMPLDDSAKDFIEISVPLKALEGYINTEFGEMPAS